MTAREELVGRLVLADRVARGRLVIEDGVIASVDVESRDGDPTEPVIAPGFVDLHVHGFGGHSAMGGRAALDGMARALLRRGVTSFLPTAVSAPLGELAAFAETVRDWMPDAPTDGAQPLGFNLEGPFLAPARHGAHDPAVLRAPADVEPAIFAPLREGLRVITIAPELSGALDLIAALAGDGVAVALGHSAATVDEARRGYAAGARSTTHLFNAMSGLDHRAPGLALAALLEDAAAVELIADGHHVARELWPLVARLKPAGRLILVSDALAIAGTPAGRGWIGQLECEIVDGRAILAGTDTLAGSVIGLDTAIQNVTAAGIPFHDAVAAASTNPCDLLGVADRGRIAVGQRADLAELNGSLQVRRVIRAGATVVG
ncbi:MAG TPA: N-acetylglucosamine-6-phosphate deacetylase [Candidatus Limnocylindrales bacterium]|nr:N-acetylglucosamine-6-phosphate deacetylase [Candidatus Limnocylindrales bacterium]